jgi:hypothetical protein
MSEEEIIKLKLCKSELDLDGVKIFRDDDKTLVFNTPSNVNFEIMIEYGIVQKLIIDGKNYSFMNEDDSIIKLNSIRNCVMRSDNKNCYTVKNKN